MATTAVEDGLGVFGGLMLPRAVEYAAINGPLRMCVDYDLPKDSYVARFDVLGARTPAIARVALSAKMARTKAAIKQRMTYRGHVMAPVNPFWLQT